MDREFLKKTIVDTLATISEQFEIIGTYESRVPKIEMDIIKSNIQKLYEYVLQFDKDKLQGGAHAETAPARIGETAPARTAETAPATDLFSTSASTLADKLQKDEGDILANKMRHEPGDDLRSGIGINEKFMFINELFEGSMQAYNEAITAFNQCRSQEEAVALIKSLSDRHSWHEDTDAMQQFNGIVNHRYG